MKFKEAMGCRQESWLQTFSHLACWGSHGVHDADEGLVAGKEAMAAGEQVAFQPAFAHVLAEHGVHDAAVAGQGLVGIQGLGVPIAVLGLEDLVQAVGHALVRPKDTEVLVFPR